PDGTEEQPTLWQFCCVKHDLKYWAGGSSDDRLRADQELGACVAGTGHPDIANTMMVGVRVGGSPYFSNPWRWGYGWEQLRAYSELNEYELAAVRKLTPPDLSKVPIKKLP
ncbi:MAG: FAD-binding oxidoreductase, partial [Bdellovibrionota bacterium]